MPRKLRIPKTKLTIPIWGWHIYFFYNCSFHDALESIGGLTSSERVPNHVQAYSFYLPETCISGVWIKPLKNMGPETHNLIAHEALHLTFQILNEKGVKYSVDSEEAYCYLHGEIVAFLVKQLSKRLNKGKRNERRK